MTPLTAMAALAAGFIADGSARLEARGGTTQGGQDPSSAGVSADLQARASNPDGALRFGLSPSAVRAQGSQLFVRGFAEAELRFRPGAWARLRQAAGFGSVDLSPVAPGGGSGPVQAPGGGGPGPVQPPPGSRFVSVEESSTSLELDVAASRRLRLAGSAAWLVSGGADANARASFPLLRGPLMRASAEWGATRLDTLRLALQAFDYRYSTGRRSSVASFEAGWRTQLARGTELALSLGPGIGRTRADGQPATTLLYAVGAADLRSMPVRDLSVSIGTAVEPLGDPLTGELVERGSLRASAVWDRHRLLTLTARLIGSVALTSGTGSPTSPQAGDRYLEAELSATVPLDPRSGLSAGLRAAMVSRPLLNQPSDQWVAFVSYMTQVPLFR